MSKANRRALILASISLGFGSSAWAQLGGLGGLLGGSKGGASGDPLKLEADLRGVNITTSMACAAIAESLGNRELAAKANSNAEGIKNNTLGVADSVETTGDMCKGLVAEMQKREAEGQKLSADAASSISKAVLPFFATFPLWKSAMDGIQSLIKSPSPDKVALGLSRAFPKIGPAFLSTVDLGKAVIRYMSFSGVDTKELDKSLQENLKKAT